MSWTCQSCTFDNSDAHSPGCHVCGAPDPHLQSWACSACTFQNSSVHMQACSMCNCPQSSVPSEEEAAAPAAAAAAADETVRVGAHVTVHGVVTRPDLNGRTGVCEAVDDQSGRWTVRFDDNTRVKLQSAKLKAVATQVLPPPAALLSPIPRLTCSCSLAESRRSSSKQPQ